MADFRKWLMAFAVITLLLGTTAIAQVPVSAPVTCTADNGVPRQVRVEGVTELVGDIILNCTGGTQTPQGQPVPLANIRIALSAPITSRILDSGTGVGEPMLTVDDPFPDADGQFPTAQVPTQGSPQGQIGCVATGGQVTDNPYLAGKVGKCQIAGVATHVETYQDQYNIFQGEITNAGKYIDFLGVPIDPPGSNFERIIRITNIRADATKVPLGQLIQATVSVSNSQVISLPSPFTTVAFVYQGFVPGDVTPQNEVQCIFPGEGDAVGVTFAEGDGFASSFKTSLITDGDGAAGGGLVAIRDDTGAEWEPQALLGVSGLNYYTESGFTPYLTDGTLVNSSDAPTPDDDSIGTADYGTRFRVAINNLQNGIDLTFPVLVQDTEGGSPDLILQLLKDTNSDGTGGEWATDDLTVSGSWTPTSGATSDYVFYEVVGDDPNLVESATVTAGVTYEAIDLTVNEPALGTNSSESVSTMTVSFAPIAADVPGKELVTNNDATNTTKRGSLPRFIVTASPADAVILDPCSCNLLYPWVVQGQGFDTGLVVVNTSISPTIWPKDTAQDGTVTLWFTGTRHGASVQNELHPDPTKSPAEPAIWVPAGCSFALIMSLGSSVNCVPVPSGEGSISPSVTTGFVGYVIATATFQYCHGVAYVTPTNDPIHGSYYEAIELDTPFWARDIPGVDNSNRTGQYGESQGH